MFNKTAVISPAILKKAAIAKAILHHPKASFDSYRFLKKMYAEMDERPQLNN